VCYGSSLTLGVVDFMRMSLIYLCTIVINIPNPFTSSNDVQSNFIYIAIKSLIILRFQRCIPPSFHTSGRAEFSGDLLFIANRPCTLNIKND